jgi:hypothetical protein
MSHSSLAATLLDSRFEHPAVIRHYQPTYDQWTLPRKKTEFFSKLLEYVRI